MKTLNNIDLLLFIFFHDPRNQKKKLLHYINGNCKTIWNPPPQKKNQNKQTNKHAKKYNWVNPHNLQALQFYYH